MKKEKEIKPGHFMNTGLKIKKFNRDIYTGICIILFSFGNNSIDFNNQY